MNEEKTFEFTLPEDFDFGELAEINQQEAQPLVVEETSVEAQAELKADLEQRFRTWYDEMGDGLPLKP